MSEMLPITPLPTATYLDIDPIDYEFVARAWLAERKGREEPSISPLELRRYVDEHNMQVELRRANHETDAEAEVFWCAGSAYVITNPDHFVSGGRPPEAEPWPLSPPDVEPEDAHAVTLAVEFQDCRLGDLDESSVEPASRSERRCVWCIAVVVCAVFWGVIAWGLRNV